LKLKPKPEVADAQMRDSKETKMKIQELLDQLNDALAKLDDADITDELEMICNS